VVLNNRCAVYGDALRYGDAVKPRRTMAKKVSPNMKRVVCN
jgi:hypothetical protein